MLKKFKDRFKGVKYFISPDYSMCGDLPKYHNIYQYGKSREIALWLTLELNSKVIPNIPCSSEDDLNFIFDGLESVEMIALSTKGRTDNSKDKNLLVKSVKYAIKKLPFLKVIIIYDTRRNDDILHLFSGEIAEEIQVILPDNLLRHRNRVLGAGENNV